MAESYEVILLAAGSARRFAHPEKLNKILVPLADRPVFDYSFRLFNADISCLKIWFVVNPADQDLIQEQLTAMYKVMPEKIEWVIGGRERQDSVSRALAQMTCTDQRKVMIHDAARPFVTNELLEALIQAGKESLAVTLGIPAKDSMKIVRDGRVHCSLYRPEVWHIQTPQLFDCKVLRQAVDQAETEHFYGNEETELVERAGYPVKVIQGSDHNFKLTTAFDYQVARMLKET
ncbi:2-C-methyl-D-erythritol 4-phosphate cytidylyltransferase [Alkalibacterium subtropicum]|uniref:2-C-methyl-D-erythritol 4-phosphate cytidylyltransferase n=1 Tax=Alkalibacterium subtropicum TaxID=753702 RepID=A0A1I1LMK7_9LACT|nr:2-C-methyl-D-erythritol 4-phosphate cytidylyltransferase [Alkalibacterium subtropicum]SFC71543.1 2-C-methyl-D-erythritol 4-phosphate cytidylyltransferase [Alkalibacterium subtropicum]